MNIINTRKRNTINNVQCSKSSKRWSKLGKITFILFECRDSLINALIFISYCYHEIVHWNKEFGHGNSKSCCKSQISQYLLSQTLNNTKFYLSTFPAKINDKIFKINKKPYFVVILAQREFFLKTLAKYNCSVPQAFKCQRHRIEQNIPSLSPCKNNSINLLNSSNRLWDIPGLRVARSLRPWPFLTAPTQ